MTHDIIAVDPEAPLESVARLVEKRHITGPTGGDGRLVGIVSRADLTRALLRNLVDHLSPHSEARAYDVAIREHIMGIIEHEAWGPRFLVDVTVADGVVELHGTITDDRADDRAGRRGKHRGRQGRRSYDARVIRGTEDLAARQ